MLKEFKTIVPYMKRYIPWYLAGFFFLFVTDGGLLYIPRLVQTAVDMIASGEVDTIRIRNIVLIMMGIAVAVGIGRFGWRVFIHGASRRIEKELRDKLFSHLLRLTSSFYGDMKTGDIMARATNDMNHVRMASGMAFVALLDGIFMTLVILIILFTKYPRLAAFTIIPMPILTVVVLFAGRLLGIRFKRVQEGFARLSELVQETISGIRVVKSFVQEDFSSGRFDKANAEYRERNMSLVRIWGFFFPIVQFLGGVTTLLLLRFGGVAVIDGALTPGEFVAFLNYLMMLMWPMIGAGFTVTLIQRGGAALGRINEVLNTEPDIKSPPNPVLEVETPHVEVKNLTYRYPLADEDVLFDVSFDVPAGSTLGILGRTGSGKSTLIKLIPRLLDPPEGTVFVGGRDVHEYDLSSLRASIGMVPQDTFLFSATVKENIAFGAPDTEEAKIERASALSTISRDLSTFPSGWDTPVGERGVTLSGGQKQRIAISRAVTVEPQILIFDDALSSVDTETEETILRGFLDARKGKTNILISHRVSTLQVADQIIVMESGRISQRGTHDELIEIDGFYQEIFNLQKLETSGSRG